MSANATNYYFSATGNDSNNGTSISTPWQTLSKFNSVFSSRSPGDSLLFKRGDTFYGTLTISRSGTAGSPIIIGAYGTGANPVITGFTTVNAWTNLGGDIWESSNAISTLPNTNMVVINGANTPMGRYPNIGYLTYQSFVSNTSITSSSLTGSPDWTGAEAVIKKERWIIDRNPITAQSGGTLTYSGGGYNGKNNWGFFIQNDSKTLDAANEWYYNPSTKRIQIYSTSSPTNVQVATVGDLVYMTYKSYITFDNIVFNGGNNCALYIGSSNNIIIQNCNIDCCYNGILGANWGSSSNNFKLQNSTINHCNNNAVELPTEFSTATVSGNTIKNTGMFAGMGGRGDGKYQGISVSGASSLVQYNEVDSTGYNGIAFNGSSVTISNNLVNYFCLLKDDGGGIYTYNDNTTGKIISFNTVLNGVGNGEGTDDPGGSSALGIYIDGDLSSGLQILNNSVANIGYGGIYLHNSHDVVVKNNTVYNSNYMGLLVKNDFPGSFITNLTITNNIFFAKASTQLALQATTLYNDISNFGIIDGNYYARPLDDNLTILAQPNGQFIAGTYYNIAGWQTYSGKDANSLKSPKTITDVNDLRFEYNETALNKVVSLPYNYMDVTGATYNGTITLAPYTSAVLIRNGAITNQPPTSNAGTDQTITLPTDYINLSGSGTDADGTITGYAWSSVSGPAGFTLGSANAATTALNNLVQGTYVFRLTVTDNSGVTATDNVTVAVNAVAQCSSTAAIGAGSIINDNSIGVFNFSSPGDAASSDNSSSSASATISILSGNTNYLKATGFNFAMPSTASICGIMVEVEKSASNISVLATVTDNSVGLVKGGIITGNNYATGTDWSSTENYYSYGGPSDLWGTTWTPAEINATDFGLVFSAHIIGLVTLLPSARIDHIRVTVYYNIVLPVQLTAFSARVQDAHSNLLQWTTPDNDEEASFTIQRSSNGNDWKNIRTLKGEINAAYKTYEFNDACSDALVYYRILIMYRDGSLNYSAIERISRLAKNILSVYPNPADNYLLIDYPERLYNIVCISANGQTYSVRFQKSGGSNYTGDIRHLPKGIYIIRLNEKSRMFVKQ